jgi:enoyl-CoA hydratase/carnithine racemase
MNEYIKTHVEEAVLHLVINRPAERNALNQQVVRTLTEEFERCVLREDVNVVLLYGEGQDAFCAGADLKELASQQGIADTQRFFRSIARLIESISRCPKPVVAKVHGYALAGGCGLAAAADVVLASRDAVFGLPEIRLGIAPMIIMAPLSRTIGKKKLADLVLTGEQFSAERAYELGLVSRIFDKGELDGAAIALAQRIASFSPLALTAAKEALGVAQDTEYYSSLTSLSDKVAMLASTDDGRSGVESFLTKTPPVWTRK